jgi:hypothetical protein
MTDSRDPAPLYGCVINPVEIVIILVTIVVMITIVVAIAPYLNSLILKAALSLRGCVCP